MEVSVVGKRKQERPWELNNRVAEKFAREEPNFVGVKKKIFSVSSIQSLLEFYPVFTIQTEWHMNRHDQLDITGYDNVDCDSRIGDPHTLWDPFFKLIYQREYTVRHRKVLWIKRTDENGKEYTTVRVPMRDLTAYDINIIFREG